jgi:hypothetical protein
VHYASLSPSARASGAQALASPKGWRPRARRRRNFLSKNRYFFGFFKKKNNFLLKSMQLELRKYTHKRSHKKLTQTHKHTLKINSDII